MASVPVNGDPSFPTASHDAGISPSAPLFPSGTFSSPGPAPLDSPLFPSAKPLFPSSAAAQRPNEPGYRDSETTGQDQGQTRGTSCHALSISPSTPKNIVGVVFIALKIGLHFTSQCFRNEAVENLNHSPTGHLQKWWLSSLSDWEIGPLLL